MPILTGTITPDGAAVDLLIRPPNSAPIASQLKSPIAIRGILDTGAGATGVSRNILKSLALPAHDSIQIRNPVGPPQTTNRYWVKLAFVSGGTVVDFGEALVLATDCFDEGEEHQALIGRDVLERCVLNYMGPSKRFTFAF